MNFFQVIRDRKVTTSETETNKYLTKRMPEARTQYNLHEYNQEITSKAIKNIPEQSSILERSVFTDNESSYEEFYDYERFKIEYEQQQEYNIKKGKVLNYTEKEEPKNTLKGTLKRIMDLKRPKNCTKEELSQIGIKTIECLLYDYQRAKDITTAKIVLWRTWLVFRVWLLIYICLAIPCWCQKGDSIRYFLQFPGFFLEKFFLEKVTIIIWKYYCESILIFQAGAAVVSVVNFVFHEKGLYLSNNITQ